MEKWEDTSRPLQERVDLANKAVLERGGIMNHPLAPPPIPVMTLKDWAKAMHDKHAT